MSNKKFEFKEALSDLLEQAQINENTLKEDDIADYFSDLDMSEEQMNHIYAYLLASGIKITGLDVTEQIEKEKRAFAEAAKKQLESAAFKGIENGTEERNADRADQGIKDTDTKILKMYREELAGIKKLSEAEETALLNRVMNEENSAELESRYIEHKLHDVVRIAEEFNVEGEYLEELIEEGNVGLTLAVQELSEGGSVSDPVSFIEDRISDAMQEYIDNELTAIDQGNAMAAKVGFVSDAAKKWKEENGESPDLNALAAFTNLTVDELTDIINLTSDKLKDNK